MKNIALCITLFFLSSFIYSQSADDVDFLDKVKEEKKISSEKESLKEDVVNTPSKESVEEESVSKKKKKPKKLVGKTAKTGLKKEYSSPVWLENEVNIDDGYLLGTKKTRIVAPNKETPPKEENTDIKNEKTLQIVNYFDGLGKYKKALIIVVLIILFGIYRIKSGGSGGSGGGMKRTPVTINKSINKYRK